MRVNVQQQYSLQDANSRVWHTSVSQKNHKNSKTHDDDEQDLFLVIDLLSVNERLLGAVRSRPARLVQASFVARAAFAGGNLFRFEGRLVRLQDDVGLRFLVVYMKVVVVRA